MLAMNAIAATPTLSQDPLWTRARAMYARAVAAIGDAASIALLSVLPRALRRDITAWLFPLECIVRRLLIAEAARLRRAEPRSANCAPRVMLVQLRSLGMARHKPSGSTRPTPRIFSSVAENGAAGAARSKLDMSRPDAWPARFSFALPRDTRLVPNSRAPRIRDLSGPHVPPPLPSHAPRKLNPADAPFRLARRFEALRRVIENPRPHAERLARVLARAARRIPHLVQRYVFTGARGNSYDPDDARLSLDALSAAFDAPGAFEDTS